MHKSLVASFLVLAACDPASPGGPDAGFEELPDAADAPSPRPNPGQVTNVVAGCDTGVGSLPGTTCQTLTITCPNVDPIDVRIRTTPPPADVVPRGTILFGSGGRGQSFSYDDGPAMPRLLAAGFRLVQRAWVGSWLGTAQGHGPAAASCRLATLAHWLRAETPAAQPLCATGNSGGAAELGEALTWWDLDHVFDQAVPTSGPGLADLAGACQPDATWQNTCATLGAASEVGPACDYASNGLDELINESYAPAAPCAVGADGRDRLAADASLAPGADTTISGMRLDILLGTRDGMVTFSQGQVFAAGVTAQDGGQVNLVITDDAPHGYPEIEPGVSVLVDTLTQGCVR